MGWPQIIWLVLVVVSLAHEMVKDGQRKEGRHNFAVSFVAFLLIFWLLWMGGFFGGSAC